MSTSGLPSSASKAVAAVEVASSVASPGVARRFVHDVLTGWNAGVDVEVALLVTSELVTNAIEASEVAVHLHVERMAEHVRIAVTDHGTGTPKLGSFDDSSAVGGRGLALVDALAVAWGVEPHADGGKAVWCNLAVTSTTS